MVGKQFQSSGLSLEYQANAEQPSHFVQLKKSALDTTRPVEPKSRLPAGS